MDELNLRKRRIETRIMTERHDLTEKQRKALIEKISSPDSQFYFQGKYIMVKSYRPFVSRDINIPAILESDELILRSLTCNHLSNYHKRLRDIYREITQK